ncbi:MAG: membrane protein insertion efficiency factor YidD [Parcubacteria group bacterium]|nr:membrane protein insertion efficiency factor YidD [Parcubacteria group bacterium]
MNTKTIILAIINQYQKFFSPDTGVLSSRQNTCVFYPTCSQYAKEAIMKYGVIKGIFLSIIRVARCHPWQKHTHDPLV